MNIAETLRAQAGARPEAPALVECRGGRVRSLSYSALDVASGRAAALLWREGLRPGDGVLVLLPMSADLYVALAAIFRLNLVAIFLHPSAGRDHIERCCAVYPPKALIARTSGHLLRVISPAVRRIPLKFAVGLPLPGAVSWREAGHLAALDVVLDHGPDAPALLTFTSGSTGGPKAAVRNHGLLMAQHRALETVLRFTPGESVLTAMPIAVLTNLASGVTSLIPDADLRQPGRIDPAPVIAQIRAFSPHGIVASPGLLERLARDGAAHRLSLARVQKIVTGGAPVFPRLIEKLQGLAPEAEIVAVYGSTEAEPIAHVSWRDLGPEELNAMRAGRGLVAGSPVAGICLRILPDRWGVPVGPYSEGDFEATCCPTGRAGEIVVGGTHVLPGYLHGHGDHETKFRVNGAVWHRTGDAGYLDARGRLWLLGRCAARIEDRHGVLYPFQAECAVYENPEIRRAAVVAHRGRRVLAIELYGGARRPDLASLRPGIHVDEIQVHSHVPVDHRHNAKIDYTALRALLDRTRGDQARVAADHARGTPCR